MLTWRPLIVATAVPLTRLLMNGALGVAENLLDGTGKLVGRLNPIVVFHRNHKYVPDSPAAVATAAIPVGVYR